MRVIRSFLIVALLGPVPPSLEAAPGTAQPDPLAVALGTLPQVWSVHLSPDG